MNAPASRWFADEAALTDWARARAPALAAARLVFLVGDLGAGKTTLARAVLRGLGHDGVVRSPTYTLIEPYQTPSGEVFHVDLYRLAGPDELELLGARELFDGDALCLIEWPERGAGWLPRPDLELRLTAVGGGRRLEITACSARGRIVAEQLQD